MIYNINNLFLIINLLVLELDNLMKNTLNININLK